SGDPGFAELVRRSRELALNAYSNQDVPFERLVEALQPERSLARHPLVQVMLVVQNVPEVNLNLIGLAINVQPLPETVAKFDLTFLMEERLGAKGGPQGLEGHLEYSLDLFDRTTAEMMASRLERLLQQAVANPDLPLHRFEILSIEERQRLLEEFNA